MGVDGGGGGGEKGGEGGGGGGGGGHPKLTSLKFKPIFRVFQKDLHNFGC